jgi:malate dehydrogenase
MARKPAKIAVVGAGAVGATLAQRVLEADLSDVVLVDIARDMAVAKALDLLDASSIVGHERSIVGTDDYSQIGGSSVVVVTAGFARKPGMTREDLVKKNVSIVKDVCANIKKFCPEAIVIIVTNPLDAMTYLALKTTGFKKERVFGMAGLLDTSRFIYLVASELKLPRSSVNGYILGSHGDTMVPVLSKTYVDDKPITDLLPSDRLDAIVERTRERGAEIVKLLGSGSAYYSPSAAAFRMAQAVIEDSGKIFVSSVFLDGEYGLSDLCIGVPCKIGAEGIEEIVELELSKGERLALNASAQAIKKTIKAL